MEEILSAPDGLAHLHIQESKHELLSIKFIPLSTLRLRWYRIQVDLDSTINLHPATLPNGTYYCVLLAKHPNNIHKSKIFILW